MNVINISHNIVIFSIITFFILIIIYNHCCSHYKEGLDYDYDLDLNSLIKVPYSNENINNEQISVLNIIPPFDNMDKSHIITNQDIGVTFNNDFKDDEYYEKMQTYPYCKDSGNPCLNCNVENGGRADIHEFAEKLGKKEISFDKYKEIQKKTSRAHGGWCDDPKPSKTKGKHIDRKTNEKRTDQVKKHKSKFEEHAKKYSLAQKTAHRDSKGGTQDFIKNNTTSLAK